MPEPQHAVAVVDSRTATERAHQAGQDAWWVYLAEVLGHLRLPYRTLSPAQATTPPADVSVLVFATAPDAGSFDGLEAWVREGGAVVVVGDPGPLADLTGVTADSAVAEDHVVLADGPVWSAVPPVALHAVGGVQLAADVDALAADTDVLAGGVEVLAHWQGSDTAAITVRRLGRGVVLTYGVDLWQTVVRIQQGYPVTADGEPAADGTAPIDDGILKCEDGMVLSFEHDRSMPPGQPPLDPSYRHEYPPPSAVPIFDQPHADWWCSLFAQSLWWAAEHVGASVPWLWYWPSGVDAVAHMSHDSDQNEEEDGQAALDAFAEAGVEVTWCQVFPGGYSPALYQAITAAGHENALHYNAMGDADLAVWGWPYIRAQYAWAQAVTGVDEIVSNKNHYTRWEGWTEFYVWCERLGIQIDESRGPSKQGAVGFTFGASQISFPMAPVAEGNRFYDVLNLPLHTQDLAWAGHAAVRDVILDGAQAVHGVAHFLFHGPHLNLRPATRTACIELAAEARRRGMPWWTAGRINSWERARRGVTLSIEPHPDGVAVRARSESALPGAAVLLALPSAGNDPLVKEGSGSARAVVRFGRSFVELTADIVAGDNRWVITP
ncbi:hypothetical protein [Kribbella sp. NPDC048915]|uniref:hypothetical protein n=1 Tax=Kribbella sp. NPDC048915 TaxID=3155148 RepID=UPI0033E2614C